MDKKACLNILQQYEFEKYLLKITKKYKHKKVLIYGAGMVFQSIKENFDLSGLDIVGISDRVFESSGEAEFLGYQVVKPSELSAVDIDVIFVASFTSLKIVEFIEEDLLKGRKMRVLPLIKKPFKELVKEVF